MDNRLRSRQVGAGAKRDTLAAQLEEDPSLSSTRRSQRAAQHANSMSKNLWERRVVVANERIAQLEAQIIERDATHARLQTENARLVEKEKAAREAKASLDANVAKLKEDAATSMAAWATKLRKLTDSNAEFQDAKEELVNTIQSLESKVSLLERKLSTTEHELEASQAQVTIRQNLSNTLRTQLEEALSENKTLKNTSGSNAGRDKEWAVIKDELARQTSHITQLTRHNAQLTRQLQAQQNAEILAEENRSLQTKVTELNAEVQRMTKTEAELRAAANAATRDRVDQATEREKEELEIEVTKLRVQNAKLLDQVGELKSSAGKLKSKPSRTNSVLEREGEDTDDVEDDSEAQIADLETEIDRMRGIIAALQVKVRVGSEERKVLRGILSTTYADADDALTARVEQLEKLIEQKDAEAGADTVDMSMRSQVGDATFSTVRWEAIREREKREKAEEEMAELTKQIEAYEETIERLEQTLFELRGEIAAGTHDEPGTRTLQLADNPEARWFAMREEEVGRMKEEINVLRARITEGGSGVATAADGGDGVPRETYENLQREKEELEEVVKQKEKRLLRLKSVFQSKAVEFRDSISSLLGYKLHFEPKHVRLTSVYDRDIDLKFASGGGNQAVMGPIRIGGGAQNKEEIETQVLELKSLWVDQKQNVPCFLAQLTMYAYERAEMGLSDWAGLDG
ncbi:Spindle assembly checkpoint component mad1 OS=Schizosaccharomyces pombe (strain 972 / ATCC 24843) GN=mad1 PE=3 SV=1 [Rhizoctonia solani AG-1 IB]|uniref:Spindle assembly checkpoint component MAD1 n=1 Tax=Thanatephorus cucumeris (strain AG1-IB / isolate 7/3/14) TaxID=1108050 RepID=A0A0B7F7S9_THACB|nr:Spindle assembly checkpoint component mad1 OS=Schizosaccharomyces pombe (strain 972 / ATCC 24843) GN=mad1 PE=3 SV=1 [Rhizoctonia solani AG-1 IB]